MAFVPNRLVILVKSATSWHGVSPIHCPENMTRNTLLVTIQHAGEVETGMEKRFYGFLRKHAKRTADAVTSKTGASS